jgi:hypothetical protein
MQTLSTRLVVCALAFGFGANAAHAKIDVVEARYEAGVLVLRGNSDHPDDEVTLDQIYKERTGHSGEFLFRVRYQPRGCVAAIRIKDESASATIANCGGPGNARP